MFFEDLTDTIEIIAQDQRLLLLSLQAMRNEQHADRHDFSLRAAARMAEVVGEDLARLIDDLNEAQDITHAEA